jgi:putative membrane protein
MTFGQVLPTVNASLNATSAVLLVSGWRAIKARRIPAHHRWMTGALIASALFLVCYLIRVALTGTHRYPHEGVMKIVYYSVLFSHMVLAVLVLPMALRTFYLARKERFDEHRKIARWTFPIWAYVSVTGVLVYVMLYWL